MWIKTASGRVLNSRYISVLSVEHADKIRSVPIENNGTRTAPDLPETGVVLVAWHKGAPVVVGSYETRIAAEHALGLFFKAATDRRATLEAPPNIRSATVSTRRKYLRTH